MKRIKNGPSAYVIIPFYPENLKVPVRLCLLPNIKYMTSRYILFRKCPVDTSVD